MQCKKWHCIVRLWFGACSRRNAFRLSFRCLPNLSPHRCNSFHFFCLQFLVAFLVCTFCIFLQSFCDSFNFFGAGKMHRGSPSSVCQMSPPLIAAIHFTGTFLQGYAFVQFTSPFDARSACLGEDAKSLCGQTLDVNMVSEPKAHISKVRTQQIQIRRQY